MIVLADRLDDASVVAGQGCLLWTKATTTGYGRIKIAGKLCIAHRVAFEQFYGPIPGGLELDHLCRNRACINPLHLEAVTPAENKRRGLSPAAINGRKSLCVRGHDLSDAYRTRDGRRSCRQCHRDYNRVWMRRHYAQAVAT